MIRGNSLGDRTFALANGALLTLLLVITLYPFWYVVMASVSDPVQLYDGSKLLLWPRGFNTEGYKVILKHRMLWLSYGNTLFYVLATLAIGLSLTVMAGYLFSRTRLPGKNVMLTLIMITMFFGGGLIPTYLVVSALKITNTRWAMIVPGVISTYNIIMMTTYFRGIPQSMEEAALIDGANDWTILTRIMVPLAKPVIAVISLYIIVAKWNEYIVATIYLRERELFPLQVILQEILISGTSNLDTQTSGYGDFAAYSEAVKYTTIIASTIPVLILYPFLQRFFVKGVMLGAVKG